MAETLRSTRPLDFTPQHDVFPAPADLARRVYLFSFALFAHPRRHRGVGAAQSRRRGAKRLWHGRCEPPSPGGVKLTNLLDPDGLTWEVGARAGRSVVRVPLAAHGMANFTMR